MRPGLVIALPQGLNVSGVTMWAVRLANTLAARGRPAGVILHGEPRGQRRLDLELDPRVRMFDCADLAPIQSCGGDLRAYVARYREAIESFAAPVAVSPNLHGDCYGVVGALAGAMGDRVRVLGWQHSDIAYDTRMLEHFGPMIARFIAVSDRIEWRLRERLKGRAEDVVNVPYGVEVGEPRRGDHLAGGNGPLRLVYAGRIEHEQKRVRALVAMSRELDMRGVGHELTLIGDGPASAEIDALCGGGGSVRRVAPMGARALRAALREADALVLASRYEGLSVSMLEAMSEGCVPIVTRVESGAGQAIEDGVNGVLAEAPPDADEGAVGCAMADAVQRFAACDRASLSIAAWETVRERFGLERHADRVETLIEEACAETGRWWPATRPCAFSGAGSASAGSAASGSGSVPAEGPARMRAVLGSLVGRRIILHGAGRHTIELAGVLATAVEAGCEIAAIADDDPGRWGSRLMGWDVIDPGRAHRCGVTDVVISSWMHEGAIWDRRGVYERQGLAVHRLYADSPRAEGSDGVGTPNLTSDAGLAA
ncbi:MAG: glycosyltransferase family 4 protein [Phycisphaeraceae bacterium]|nr:glycosyltransferase family 4 protein [Phycisphaeraceae bacterium]